MITMNKWHLAKTSFFLPIYEFNAIVRFFKPRELTNMEWALMTAVHYFQDKPNYKGMLLKDIFERIFCVPQSEDLVYPVFLEMYHSQRIFNCNDSSIWENISLQDVQFTSKGTEVFQSKQISISDQEKGFSYLFDPVEKALVPNGTKNLCLETLKDEHIALINEDDVSFVFPRALVEQDVISKKRIDSEAEIRSIESSQTGDPFQLIWRPLNASFELNSNGQIEVKMDKKEYIPYVEQFLKDDPASCLPIQDDPSLPIKTFDDTEQSISQLVSLEEEKKTVQEAANSVKGVSAIQFVRENLYEEYNELFKKSKGLIVKISPNISNARITSENNLDVLMIPEMPELEGLLYLNQNNHHLLRGRFQMSFGEAKVFNVFDYQLRNRQELWQQSERFIDQSIQSAISLSLQQNNVEEALQHCLFMCHWRKSEDVWPLYKRIMAAETPFASRLQSYKQAQQYFIEKQIKRPSHFQLDILEEMIQQLDREVNPIHSFRNWLDIYPLPILSNDVKYTRDIMEKMPVEKPSSLEELQSLVESFKHLNMHQPTIFNILLERFYTEKIAAEHYAALSAKEVFGPKHLLTDKWLEVISAAEFFQEYKLLGVNDFCKTIFKNHKILQINQTIKRWATVNKELEKALSSYGLNHEQVLSFIELDVLNEKISELQDWIRPYLAEIDQKQAKNKIFVLDVSAVLEKPTLMKELAKNNIVILSEELRTELMSLKYNPEISIEDQEKIDLALDIIQDLKKNPPKAVRWITPFINRLPVTESEGAAAQYIALNYITQDPHILTTTPNRYEGQGINSPKVIELADFMESFISEKQNSKSGKKGKKKK